MPLLDNYASPPKKKVWPQLKIVKITHMYAHIRYKMRKICKISTNILAPQH